MPDNKSFQTPCSSCSRLWNCYARFASEAARKYSRAIDCQGRWRFDTASLLCSRSYHVHPHGLSTIIAFVYKTEAAVENDRRHLRSTHTMTSPTSDPGTEPLPDYHELITSNHRQYSKDTFELRTMPRSIYLCLLFLCYTAIALSSWVIFCYIGRGPVPDGYWEDLSRFRDPANGPRDFKAASVLATVAAILTLPTAAAICAYAAVPFAQYHAKGQKLTLRKTVALANQDWMSPLILPTSLIPSRNRTYGSHFLYFASFLTIIGNAFLAVFIFFYLDL